MRKFGVQTIRKFKLNKGCDYILFIPTSSGLTDIEASELIGIFKKHYSDVTIVFVESVDDIKIIEKKINDPEPKAKLVVTSDSPQTDFKVEDMIVDRPTAGDISKQGTLVEETEEAMAETLISLGETPKKNDD